MNWDTISLGDLASKGGGSVDPRNYPDEMFELYSIPAFDAGAPEVVAGREIGSSKKAVEPNDVMISRIVPHIRRAWVVGQRNGLRQIASGEWIVFRDDRVWPQYLKWVLVSDAFHPAFMRTVSGIGGSLLRARPVEVHKISIPLPPLPEQKRIAAILDAADTLRAKRQESLAQLDALLQSVFLDIFGDPVTNPMGWEQEHFGDIADQITDGEHLNPEFSSFGMPIVMAGNVLESGVNLEDTKHVDNSLGEKFRRKCKPEKSDILLVSRGATIGRTCVVDTDQVFCLMGSVILVKVSKSLTNPAFLSGLLKHPAMRRTLYRTSGSSAQQAIYIKDVRKLRCICPPIKLQTRFAGLVERVEQLKSRHRAHSAELDTLFDSLQSRAFRGDL